VEQGLGARVVGGVAKNVHDPRAYPLPLAGDFGRVDRFGGLRDG